jgi:hypothetical protein
MYKIVKVEHQMSFMYSRPHIICTVQGQVNMVQFFSQIDPIHAIKSSCAYKADLNRSNLYEQPLFIWLKSEIIFLEQS